MKTSNPKFVCIHLGVEGGLNEANLSAHLLAPIGSTEFACLDAGTIVAGLKTAIQMGSFSDIPIPEDAKLTPEGHILHNHIKAYLISHSYLDHVSGLALVSPNDNQKAIMSLEGTIHNLQNHVFNWRTWPNFADIGVKPCLSQYNYVTLPAWESQPIPNTLMTVEGLPLSHGHHTDSTAFLIESDGFYVLYLGDTGPDEVENSTKTQAVWKRIAPLIREGRLRGIFTEASYINERPDNELFAHLTPAWVMRGLRNLAELVDSENPQQALRGLNLIVTHIKPWFQAGLQPRQLVESQLFEHNDLGINLLFANQGKKIEF